MDVLPRKTVFLNTGQELAFSNELLQIHRQRGHHFLWFQGLPRDLLDAFATWNIGIEHSGYTDTAR